MLVGIELKQKKCEISAFLTGTQYYWQNRPSSHGQGDMPCHGLGVPGLCLRRQTPFFRYCFRECVMEKIVFDKEKILESLRELENKDPVKKVSAKSSYLLEIKDDLLRLSKAGYTTKDIWNKIQEAGFKVSYSTVRATMSSWINSEKGKKIEESKINTEVEEQEKDKVKRNLNDEMHDLNEKRLNNYNFKIS